jgi:hypothetical protein
MEQMRFNDGINATEEPPSAFLGIFANKRTKKMTTITTPIHK